MTRSILSMRPQTCFSCFIRSRSGTINSLIANSLPAHNCSRLPRYNQTVAIAGSLRRNGRIPGNVVGRHALFLGLDGRLCQIVARCREAQILQKPLMPGTERMASRFSSTAPSSSKAHTASGAGTRSLWSSRPEDLADLIEDAAAAAAYHRTRDQERVPIGVVDRLIAGENPVRVWREHRGHSLRQLAEHAGVGFGYLSQIENGERKGTVETLKKIAAALDVDLDD